MCTSLNELCHTVVNSNDELQRIRTSVELTHHELTQKISTIIMTAFANARHITIAVDVIMVRPVIPHIAGIVVGYWRNGCSYRNRAR